MTPAELLVEFTRQVRLSQSDAGPFDTTERVGLVHRTYPTDPEWEGTTVESPLGLGGSDDEVERAIDTEIAFFTGRHQSFEWKTYATDEPADLIDRLRRRGFEVGDVEVVMLGECRHLVDDLAPPDGLRIREFDGADWERVRVLMDGVWGTGATWVNDALRAEQERDPALLRPVLVEEIGGDRRVVAYAALRLTPGVDFAGLWGGTTHPGWRGRGLYRALTAHRARLALEAGRPFARVDTSPDSRPILTRLGLHQVTTTTPCVFSPDGTPDASPLTMHPLTSA